MQWLKKIPTRWYVIAIITIITIAVIIENSFGRELVCKCGTIKLWEGTANSSGNSQHISDWYSFSHIIHGFILYFVAWLVARRLPVGLRLVIAVLIETAWEVFENSSFVINRYRAETISLDYFGDSILNSVCDILFMILGYLAAIKMPTWLIITVIIIMEIFVGYYIRDNLTLNIIMLIHPVDTIKLWQLQ